MHSHELLREVFQKANPKQVSADLGLSLSMIYKWAEPTDEATGSGTSNPLDRLPTRWAATCRKSSRGGSHFLRRLAVQSVQMVFNDLL
jgi:hypothetical protein